MVMDTWVTKYVNYLPCSFSDYLFKLLLIGDSGVGKSCLLLRFAVSTALHVVCVTSLRSSTNR